MGQIIHEEVSAEDLLKRSCWVLIARLLSLTAEQRTRPINENESNNFIYQLMSWKVIDVFSGQAPKALIEAGGVGEPAKDAQILVGSADLSLLHGMTQAYHQGLMFSPIVQAYKSKQPGFELKEGSEYVLFVNPGTFDRDIYQLTLSNAYDSPSLLDSLHLASKDAPST